MNKKREKAEKKINNKKVKSEKRINERTCRQASDKDKSSKVEKLMALAKKHPHKEKKKGFFARLFG